MPNSQNVRSNGGKSNANGYRLPDSVIPKQYVIELKPNLDEFTFAGFETIYVTIKEPVSRITLHAKELQVTEALATAPDGTIYRGSIEFDQAREFLHISFSQTLPKGDWQLVLSFAGELNQRLKGFYRSTFTHETLGKQTIATTQFEPTDARGAFPCFDEPQLKATFKIFLVIPEGLEAISNGRKLSETIVEQGVQLTEGRHRLKRVEFEETMKMSTYLVAFIVGRFVSSTPVTANGKELRVWCTPGKEDLTAFGLHCAAFAIRWYEEFFEIPYPGGSKIDFIAIPDFSHGAMENLGCITFRETALLVNESTATHAELKRVAEVVLHELAHMWFGDLVTMSWWTWLWLNEAFATFMECLCLDDMYPQWQVWDAFAISRAAALRVDSLKSTHPIECPVERPEEAQELFDAISYLKGCSVLYMIYSYMGRELFRRGVALYLKKFSYSDAEGHDLWDCLQAVCKEDGSKLPIRQIMDSWVLKPGHPLLEVSQRKEQDSVAVSQSDFKFLREAATDTIWPVPVQIKLKDSSGKINHQWHLLSSAKEVIAFGDKFKWLALNAKGSGFFRVVYKPEMAKPLIENVMESLTVIERFNLLNDSWSCLRAGTISSIEFLQMIQSFANETDPHVWNLILASTASLYTLLPEERQADFASFLQDLLRPSYKRLGWSPSKDEDVQTRELRGAIIGALGTLAQDQAVREKASQLFALWLEDRKNLDNNVLPGVVETLAFIGDEARFDQFFQLFQAAKEKNPQDEQRFRSSLGMFQKPALYERAIQLALSEHMRTQDAPFFLTAVMLQPNPEKSRAVWRFICEHWDAIVKAYPSTGVVRMCGSVTALDTPELEAQVKDFFATHEVRGGNMAMNQALEQLHVNVSMRLRETKRLAEYVSTIGKARVASKLT